MQQRKKLHAVRIVLHFFPSDFPPWNYRTLVSHKAHCKATHWAGARIQWLIWFACSLPQATSHLGKENGKEGGVLVAWWSRAVVCKLSLLSAKFCELLSRCLERRWACTICRGGLVVMTANYAAADLPFLNALPGFLLWNCAVAKTHLWPWKKNLSRVEMKELAISSLEI